MQLWLNQRQEKLKCKNSMYKELKKLLQQNTSKTRRIKLIVFWQKPKKDLMKTWMMLNI